MNLILFNPAEQAPDWQSSKIVRISDTRRLLHLEKILKAQAGQKFLLGALNGNMGLSELIFFNSREALFHFEPTLSAPPALSVHLILALPRPRMLARTLENISAFGVKQLTLLQTARVEKSFWQTPLLKSGLIRHHCELGLEQACDTVLPSITEARHFDEFIHQQLPLLLKKRQGWVAHPKATQNSLNLPSKTIPTLLFIGPEGGFIEPEIEILMQKGVEAFRFGNRILRVETAVTAILARFFLTL